MLEQAAEDLADPAVTDPLAGVIPVSAGLAASALLAGCGGGGGGAAPTASGQTPPAAPPPVIWSPPADAPYARFLQQAQFESSTVDIAAVKAKGYAAWLDEQMALPSSQGGWEWLQSRGYGVIDRREFYFAEWYLPDYMVWYQILKSPDQVRRRMALALSEFFVVGADGIAQPWFKAFQLAHFFDILCKHAFGGFRELLEEVTLCVAMGSFLNTLYNEKEDPVTGRLPDENYAREVMQLFTIGVDQLNLDGTPKTGADGRKLDAFTQEDVTNLARVFTGWVLDDSGGVTSITVGPFTNHVLNVEYTRKPMVLRPHRHSLLEKRFLGTTIPAGTDGSASLKAALDTLANHPNVGPFFARQMIQRLVTSDPSPAYVARVASVFNDNGNGKRGDLKAVFRTILLDDEARGAASLASPTHGKLREPMLRFAHWGRAFKLTSTAGTWKFNPPNWSGNSLSQYPLRAPSVFNFFRPGYVPPNTDFAARKATAPEFQLVNETSVSQYINFLQNILPNGLWVGGPELLEQPMGSTPTDGHDIKPDYSAELALVTDPAALVRHLNLILAAGRLSQATETTITDLLKLDGTTATSSDNAKLYTVCRAVLSVMCSPEYLVQK
ncbi:MAG: DUF1800 family protein [Gammaproteobacteria bacterium]